MSRHHLSPIFSVSGELGDVLRILATLLKVKMDSHSCEHWRSNGDNWSSASLVANPGEILRGSEDPHVTQYASRNFAIEREETRQRQNILIVLKPDFQRIVLAGRRSMCGSRS